MCGRFALHHDDDEVAERFCLQQEETNTLTPRYNIAPTQTVAAVIVDAGVRCLRPFRWGLIPPWASDPKIGVRMINARSETIATKPAFREAFHHRRCLVIASGYYEWKWVKGRKTPYFIRLATDQPFAMAGLWEEWLDGDGRRIRSCTIVTTAPNAVASAIHHRMPAMFDNRGDEATWLDESGDIARLQALLRPFAGVISAYPVSPTVNRVASDNVGCIHPVDDCNEQQYQPDLWSRD